MRVVVAGAGVAGLAAALALGRADPDVLDRARRAIRETGMLEEPAGPEHGEMLALIAAAR